MLGKSVRLFFVDGSPSGLITAELMNWTGQILVAPRSRLGTALKRDEVSRTGVYILIGQDPDKPSLMRIYIGEGDNVAARLKSHAKDAAKDFWTKACIVTSKDFNLTKAHVRYLEQQLVNLANATDRVSVANGNEPAEKALPEADISDMEAFVENLRTVFPAIGLDFLDGKDHHDVRDTAPHSLDASDLELTLTHKSGIVAKAIERGGEIIVRKNSQVQPPADYATNQYGDLRDQLIRDGIIHTNASTGAMTFTKDHKFNSPSAAAAVIIGRNSNGRRNWRLAGGQSLGDYQDRQLT